MQPALRKNLADFSLPLLQVLSELALVIVTDVEGTIIYTNDYFRKISKYSEDELIGKNHDILISGKHPASFYEAVQATLEKGEISYSEMSSKAKDGSIYWVNSSIAPLFGADGEIIHYVGVGFLITDKIEAEAELNKKTSNLQQIISEMQVKETELENTKKAILNVLEDLDEERDAVERKVVARTAEIQHEKEKLHQVTKNIKDGIILLDGTGSVIFANEGLYQLFDFTEETVPLSSILTKIYAYCNQTDITDYFERCLRGETFGVSEIENQGQILEMFFSNFEVNDTNNGEKNYFVLLSDVTEAKLLERSKSELVAVASHQLRTPLTAMRGNIEMLIDESYGALNTEQHELLRDVDISTNRLISMVNDMLDITKIEKGNLDMIFERVAVKEVIDSICSDLADYANRRTVSLNVHLDNSTAVYGDKSRVRQVLQNLIDNAVKYSRNPGTLNISSRVDGDQVTIILQDNGLGIPKLEHSKIFNRFYRASNTSNSASSGSGLGLYIVKSIVEQLQGTIWFESEENVGTTFFVALPKSA